MYDAVLFVDNNYVFYCTIQGVMLNKKLKHKLLLRAKYIRIFQVENLLVSDVFVKHI